MLPHCGPSCQHLQNAAEAEDMNKMGLETSFPAGLGISKEDSGTQIYLRTRLALYPCTDYL